MKHSSLQFLLLFLLLCTLAIGIASACEGSEPYLEVDTNFSLYEGIPFIRQVRGRFPDKTIFSYALLNATLQHFTINTSTGEIHFTPTQADVGLHKIMLIASTPEDCYDSSIINLQVYDRPELLAHWPDNASIREGKPYLFNSSIRDTDPDESFQFSWSLDKSIVSRNQSFLYKPDYDAAGIHTLNLNVSDSIGLTASSKWIIQVGEFNRPPLFIHTLQDLYLYPKQEIYLYDLHDYFIDPDNDNLFFSVGSIRGSTESSSQQHPIIVDEMGKVSSNAKTNSTGKSRIFFLASDEHGASTKSNVFSVYIVPKKPNSLESGETAGEACSPEIVCMPWGPCQPTYIRIRNCSDEHGCSTPNATITQSEFCFFNASCNDGIRNQNETGVDCGGSCKACPTCEDAEQNQGEEGIDCGGPCAAQCPSCRDLLINQDETDADCGGTMCEGCQAGKKCRSDADCLSFHCGQGACQSPTCRDARKNQDELEVDCGGPCLPCPTCYDGIQNQDEILADCGGSCGPCPTCQDGVINQGESLPDCGGPCRRCTFLERARYSKGKIVYILMLVLVMGGALVWKKYKKDEIGFLISLIKKTSLEKEQPEYKKQVTELTVKKLSLLKQTLAKSSMEEASLAFAGIIKDYYKELFGLDEPFSHYMLQLKAKQEVSNPLVRKLLIKFFKTVSRENTPYFKAELEMKIDWAIATITACSRYV